MAEKAKGPAIGKRLKISKAQQITMLEVLVAAILAGTAAVLSVWLVRNIAFNTQVLTEQDKSISNFKQSQRNVSTLEENVMVMANNENLESVAREGLADCYNSDGTKKNLEDAYDGTDSYQKLRMIQTCSALRVVPDALPNQENTEAALSSLDQLFTWAGVVPDSLAPDSFDATVIEEASEEGEGEEEDKASALQVLPLRMTIESNDNDVFRALTMVDRSIREFDVSKLTIEWSNDGGLSAQAQVMAYYAGESKFQTKTKKVVATEKKE